MGEHFRKLCYSVLAFITGYIFLGPLIVYAINNLLGVE